MFLENGDEMYTHNMVITHTSLPTQDDIDKAKVDIVDKYPECDRKLGPNTQDKLVKRLKSWKRSRDSVSDRKKTYDYKKSNICSRYTAIYSKYGGIPSKYSDMYSDELSEPDYGSDPDSDSDIYNLYASQTIGGSDSVTYDSYSSDTWPSTYEPREGKYDYPEVKHPDTDAINAIINQVKRECGISPI
jgi:hypothetical protein